MRRTSIKRLNRGIDAKLLFQACFSKGLPIGESILEPLSPADMFLIRAMSMSLAHNNTAYNVIMNGPSGATLTFAPNAYGSSSSSSQATSSHVPSGTTFNLSGTIGVGDDYCPWLGGGLGLVSSGQTAGL